MSSNVFLVPYDSENFERTVLSEVDLGEFPDRPAALSDSESVRFLGTRADSGGETYFEKMEAGDLLLFYNEEEYVGTGRIGTTFTDSDGWASEQFWDDTSSSLIYTIEDFTPTSVPQAALNRIFDYSESYKPSGLMRVAANRVNNDLDAIELAVQRYN